MGDEFTVKLSVIVVCDKLKKPIYLDHEIVLGKPFFKACRKNTQLESYATSLLAANTFLTSMCSSTCRIDAILRSPGSSNRPCNKMTSLQTPM